MALGLFCEGCSRTSLPASACCYPKAVVGNTFLSASSALLSPSSSLVLAELEKAVPQLMKSCCPAVARVAG